MPRYERDRQTDRISKARLVLAVPSAVVASLKLHEMLPPFWATTVGVVVYLLLVSAVLSGVAFLWRRYVAGPLSRWLATGDATAHLDQCEARRRAKHYATRLRLDPLLLDLSVWEFAREAGLSICRAWAVLKNPDVIIRPEKQARIEKVLLLPPGFFLRGRAKDGTKYGEEMTRARLQRYFDRQLVRVYLKKNDPRMHTARSRARLLYQCEKELIESLTEQGRLEGGE